MAEDSGRVGQIVELALVATAEPDSLVPEPSKLVELIGSISGHYLDTFLQCHKHLTSRLNSPNAAECNEISQSQSIASCVSSQLKLCFHEREQHKHTCVHKNLVSLFRTYKTTSPPTAPIDQESIDKLFDFVPGFGCISQLGPLLELFNVNALDQPELVALTQRLIDQNCHIQAAIVINQLDMRQHFDSNTLLINLLYEDNLLDIESYLNLENLKINQTTLNQFRNCDNTDTADSHIGSDFILLKFMQYLDGIFLNSEELVLRPQLQQQTSSQRKLFYKKVYRFALELFKRPVFDELDDQHLFVICPNISKDFYSKQLSGLFFRFKEPTVPMSPYVMSDHIDSLHNVPIADEFLPQTHDKVVSLFAKRNDFISAAEYIRIYKLNSNLSTYTNPTGALRNQLLNFYQLKLSLNDELFIVDNDELFERFLSEAQEWKLLALDSEWFNNFFLLRSNSLVSLIQIANEERCYLIDCVTLAKNKPLHFYLEQIISKLINAESIRKIGYSIQNDYDVIYRTYFDSLKKDVNSDEKTATCLLPQNTIDFRELYFFLLHPSNQQYDLFDSTCLQIANHLSGLSQVTYACTGFIIDKTEQMSDWTKRPLRDSQIQYAAIDVHCLIECYHQLEQLFTDKTDISLDTFLTEKYNKKIVKIDNFDKKKGKQLAVQTEIVSLVDSPIIIRNFRCVVDDMLAGIIRYLRICNADALMVAHNDRDQSVRMALRENRVFITSGQVYERYRKHFDNPTDCIRLSNASTSLEQFKELATKCRLVIRLEDLFARCSLCNTTPFIIIPPEEFKSHYTRYLAESASQAAHDKAGAITQRYTVRDETRTYQIDFEQFGKMKFVHKMPQVDKFYICPNESCGHVYWDGCHSSNFVHSIKSLIVDA